MNHSHPPQQPTPFAPPGPGGRRNLLDTLRAERTGGILLVAAALLGLVLANGPTRTWFARLAGTELTAGPVTLDVAHWASEGLLAIFFLVVGLELTREIQVGELRRLRTAVVPVVGAIGGMAAPALIYLGANLVAPGGDVAGWAIPTATDIAFAVAVLALVAPGLPLAIRAFLLTLAVVDDLLAILIIAVGFSDGVSWTWLLGAVAGVALVALLLRSRVARAPWLPPVLVVLGVATWVATLNAGLHATLAGVAIGLAVPARSPGAAPDVPADDGAGSLAERYEHVWRPISAGLAVPLFALFAAGVRIDPALLGATLRDPVAWGIVLGLVVGKPLGITASTWLLCRFTGASLAPGVTWRAIGSVSCLAGIGFTVSLLIGSLAFGDGDRTAEVVIAVLVASVLAAGLGAAALRQLPVHQGEDERAERGGHG
ncbi:Na+/H+ antiporter NhaA [Serinibacter arcticus]|uniref:Na(+)/H(+) antiporter NhaA n=1 Tax=Serinibacter arcticus TaxID=1655435 RepID=A0A4Z1DYQ0_9MICO|nr:Na+/H+ antiporter NhaA [Serinibacter arcticus]TGO04059.1 Na+/H+ antiporter NhaA type [Serinibacter arcticus]